MTVQTPSARDDLRAKRYVRCSRHAIDTAIDWQQTNLWTYRVTRAEKQLVVLPGQTPAWIHVERLSRRMHTAIMDSVTGDQARIEIAFRAAVRRVEVPGREALTPDPKLVEPWRAGGSVAGDEWVDQIADLDGFGFEVVLDYGFVALETARLAPGADGPFGSPPGLDLSP